MAKHETSLGDTQGALRKVSLFLFCLFIFIASLPLRKPTGRSGEVQETHFGEQFLKVMGFDSGLQPLVPSLFH